MRPAPAQLFGTPPEKNHSGKKDRPSTTPQRVNRKDPGPQEVAKSSNRIKAEIKGSSIRMRIGIHTGPVVLGAIGQDLRLEFQVMGDTVNLAARVESLAEPGSTYVTEETFKQTRGFFRFEKMGARRPPYVLNSMLDVGRSMLDVRLYFRINSYDSSSSVFSRLGGVVRLFPLLLITPVRI